MRYFSGGRSGVRSKAAHILAHIVLSSAVAATGGNDALTAGISAGGAELAAPVISKWLYGTDNSEELNADQKTTISAIAGLIGTGVGLSTGGSVTDIAASSQLTQNAVTNNWLFKKKFMQCNVTWSSVKCKVVM